MTQRRLGSLGGLSRRDFIRTVMGGAIAMGFVGWTGIRRGSAAEGEVSLFFEGLSIPAVGDTIVDKAGNLYVSDPGAGLVWKVSPAGKGKVFAKGFAKPTGAALDLEENLYVADQEEGTIHRVTPDGQVSLVSGGHKAPAGITFDLQREKLYVVNRDGGSVVALDFSGPAVVEQTVAEGFRKPIDLAFTEQGDLLVTDPAVDTVFRVDPASGETSPFLTDLDAPKSPTGGVTCVVLDVEGNVYLTPVGTDLIKVAPSGERSTVISGQGILMNPIINLEGKLYVERMKAGQIIQVAVGVPGLVVSRP